MLDPVADENHLPRSIKAHFSPDFWSVGTFSTQSGFMGILADTGHPALSGFPTGFHSEWQWWELCSRRAFILPDGMKSIVTGLDSYAYMRNLSLLFEARIGKGKLILSSMGLLDGIGFPEVNAMLESLTAYAASEDFAPEQELTEEALCELVREDSVTE